MHLQAMGFDELNFKHQKQTGNYSSTSPESANNAYTNPQFVTEEIAKDSMLYKALYVIVAYFCIGTELRFLAVLNPTLYSLKDSEIWHAKAIHVASYFLPNDCPLIQHIT
jgi:hypothetical protein